MSIFQNHGLLFRTSSIIGSTILITTIGLSLYIPNQLKLAAEQQAIDSAQRTVNQFKQVRGYYTANIIKRVKASGSLQPHFDHKGYADRIPLPATMIHELSEIFEQQGTSLDLYSAYPFPHRNSRQLDEFQQQAWTALNQNPERVFSQRSDINGKSVVRVAMADTMQSEACVSCHNTHPQTPRTGWKLGDVRGVLEVQTPIDEQIAASQALGWKISAILIASLIVTLSALIYIFRSQIASRLDKMSIALENIANGKGDLRQRLDVTQNDEISQVANAFNQFLDGMKSMVTTLNSQTEELFTASSELQKAATQTREGTEQQDRETEQIATAVEQMSATAEEVARLAKETSTQAQQTLEIIMQGRQVVNESTRSFDNLSTEISTATQVIAELEADSSSIGSVLDVIRGIAEQTNLLALNAAIEAARAGEQGRGFAVVADEVRTLASRTQSSTAEIQQMIEKLQSGVKNAVHAMSQGSAQLEVSLERSQDIHSSMERISEAMTSINDMNNSITTAAHQQSQTTEEINRNINQVSTISQDCSRTAVDSENAANQLAGSGKKIATLLSRFRI